MAHLNTFTLTFLLLALLFLTTPITATRGRDIYVHRGQSIQRAINRAACGDKIIVGKGVYKEQLVIDKDDITLIGKGAVLEPPKTYKKNKCTSLAGGVRDANNEQTKVPTQAGICIVGDVKFGEFVIDHRKIDTVKRHVQNPSVSGFEVRGFSGLNIAIVGAQNARVFKNKLVDGQQYGILTVGSKNTKAEKNDISTSRGKFPYIGICTDDKSDVKIWNNDIAGYFIGLCVQTNYADVKRNHVSGTCYGAFVDPGIVGAQLRYNSISDTAAYCATLPFPASAGIIVSGATKTEVRWNYIKNINDRNNDTKTAVGIGIYDNSDFGPTVLASGNVVKENYLKGNELDIQIFSNGAGNIAKRNKCETSFPEGACI